MGRQTDLHSTGTESQGDRLVVDNAVNQTVHGWRMQRERERERERVRQTD